MDYSSFLNTQDIDLSMRELNRYVIPPHFALDDVTRFRYTEAARQAKGPLAEAAMIDAANAIRAGDIGLADVHLAAAVLLAGVQYPD